MLKGGKSQCFRFRSSIRQWVGRIVKWLLTSRIKCWALASPRCKAKLSPQQSQPLLPSASAALRADVAQARGGGGLDLGAQINKWIYIYIYNVYLCVYIYIYIDWACPAGSLPGPQVGSSYKWPVSCPSKLCAYTYIYIYIHTHMCVYIYIYIYTYMTTTTTTTTNKNNRTLARTNFWRSNLQQQVGRS